MDNKKTTLIDLIFFKNCVFFNSDGTKMCLTCHRQLCPKHKQLKKLFTINDSVNHPSHYTDGKIEVIEYIEDKKLDFCLGNAIKYISRAGKKDKTKEVEDLEKAIWYINRKIKEIQETNINIE